MIATNQALNMVLIFFVVPGFCKLGTIHICTALKKQTFYLHFQDDDSLKTLLYFSNLYLSWEDFGFFCLTWKKSV